MAGLDVPASLLFAFKSLRGMGTPMFTLLRQSHSIRMPLCSGCALLMAACLLCFPDSLLCATIAVDSAQGEQEIPSAGQSTAQTQNAAPSNLETAKDWNRRLKKLLGSNPSASAVSAQEYRIGSEDVLNINVFEAQELNREVRVSASGEMGIGICPPGTSSPYLHEGSTRERICTRDAKPSRFGDGSGETARRLSNPWKQDAA